MAIKTRPSPLCYLHLLQGGGVVGKVAGVATAFGCQDWDFACVVIGVWPRDQDGTRVARGAIQWVYNITKDLLPLSSGAYGADLGPDPRDAALAAKAFGPNRPRLAQLKHSLDPRNVLAYTCPLPKAPTAKLIVLVTGKSGAGKDYCADIWVSMFARRGLKTRAVSISDAADVDVLLITGMRDEAPVAAFSPLVPGTRLLEVRIKASKETQRARQGYQGSSDDDDDNKDNKDSNNGKSNPAALKHCPSLTFNNDTDGNEASKGFAEHYLLPFLSKRTDLQRLANMVRPVPDFPHPGIEFRHVLNISQQPGGLALCTSLLQAHFIRDGVKVDVVACCEAGGFVYASALAVRVNVPLALIREAGIGAENTEY